MPARTVHAIGLLCLVGAASVGCGPKAMTRAEALAKGLNDKGLSDSEAIPLVAQGCFRTLVEAAALPPSDGKVMAVVIIKGSDTSILSGSVVKTAAGGMVVAMKKIQMVGLFSDLDKFIKEGVKRNLGDVTLTLKVPTSAGGEAQDWIDTYRFTLPARAFDRYLKTSPLDTAERISQAERIWSVKLDEFKNFKYSSGE